MFQLTESFVTLWGPVEGHVFLCKSMQRRGYLGKSRYESAVVRRQANKLAEGGYIVRYRKTLHFVCFSGIRADTLCRDHMTQVWDLVTEEETLFWLKTQASITQSTKYFFHVLEMLFESAGSNKYVI